MKNPFSAPTGNENHEKNSTKGEDNQPPPSQKPAPEVPQLTPEQHRTLSSSMYLTATLMFATLISTMLPLPLRMAAVGFAVWGVFAGIRTVRLATRWKVSTFQRFALLLGVGLTMFLGISVALTVTRWDIEMDYQECHRQALTVQAENSCETEYRDALTELYGRFSAP